MGVTDGKGSLRMNAYYYSFNTTDCLPIDKVLSAVACAGKAYHYTEDWSDAPWGDPEGPSEVDKIQAAADEAAGVVRELVEALEDLKTVVEDVLLPQVSGEGWLAEMIRAQSTFRQVDAVLAKIRGGAAS